MYKITIQLFDKDAEVVSFGKGTGNLLEIKFTDIFDGYVVMGNIKAKINNGKAKINTLYLKNGEYSPKLLMNDAVIDLPKLYKEDRLIKLSECDGEYAHSLSLREYILRERVRNLEEEIEKLNERVYGTTVI